MSNRLKFDTAGRVDQPTLILATKSGKKFGALTNFENCVARKYLNEPDTLSFTVYKYDGNIKNPLWDDIVDFRCIWYQEVDEWFELEVEINDSDTTKKNLTCTALCESELSQTNLVDVEINTEDDIARDDYTTPTTFYNDKDSSSSLLNRILDKVPNYTVNHVSDSLKNIQRKFSFDGDSIYDALMTVSEEVECLFVFGNDSDKNGKPCRTISAYDLKEYCRDCGYRFDSGDTCPECGSANITSGYGENTGIVISKENLTDTITYTASHDNVKNCFRLVAGDDLMTAVIRTCNPNGSNYLWHILDSMKADMSDELVQKLNDYNILYNKYNNAYDFTIDSDDYNALVLKYMPNNNNLKFIRSSPYNSADDSDVVLKNYPAIVEAYYYAYDLGAYLQTTMMPALSTSSTNVDTELAKIQKNLTTASVPSLSSSTSTATIETSVKSAAKLLINTGKYQVKVNTSSWDNPKWTGTVTITNWGDDTDTGTTSVLTVTASASADTYIEQMIANKLNEVDDDLDIVSLFSKSDSDFQTALKLYNLDSLKQFADSCQTCIDILIEQGCGDSSHYMYSSTYVPWRNKLAYLQSEVDVRATEVGVITGEDGILARLDTIKEDVSAALDFESYVGTDLWNEFLPYRREDEYSNDNYISDGLSNAELINNAKEFLETAKNELYKAAELQHTISSNLYNLLAIKEFSILADQFAVGNWIYIIVDEVPYKLRMTKYEIAYDNLEQIDVEFSDVLKTLDGMSDVKSVLDAASAMATSYDFVARQAGSGSDASNTINGWAQDGLNATNTRIVSNANNQEMTLDSHGLLGRRYEDVTETYSPRQCKLTNTTLAFTDDDWETVKTALGMVVNNNGEYVYGLVADNIIGKLIAGEKLVIKSSATDDVGESLFQVDENGVSLKIVDSDTGGYADASTLIDNAKTSISELQQTAGKLTTRVTEVEDDCDTLAQADTLLSGKIAEVEQTATGLSSSVSDIKKELDPENADGTVAQLTGKISTAQQTADAVTTTVSELTKDGGRISKVEQTASGLSSRVTIVEGDMSTLTKDGGALDTMQSEIDQKVDSITLSVNDNTTSKKASIALAVTKNGKTTNQSGTIDMTGLVSFTNLSTSGSTQINGANITTGTISADRIDVNKLLAKDVTATGNFQVKNSYYEILTGASESNEYSISLHTTKDGNFPSGLLLSDAGTCELYGTTVNMSCPVATYGITASGNIVAKGTITSTGKITANGGITVPSGQNITVNGVTVIPYTYGTATASDGSVWSYKKYQDGTCELWGYKTITGLAINSLQFGSMYYSYPFRMTYPFSVTSASCTAEWQSDYYGWAIATQRSMSYGSSTPNYIIMRPKTADSASGNLVVRVYGLWTTNPPISVTAEEAEEREVAE